MIKLELRGYELEDSWQENIDSSDTKSIGNEPQLRWFRAYDVYLAEGSKRHDSFVQKILLGITQRYKEFPGFFMHYIVCSPAMAANPPADLKDQIATAHAQNRFDEDEAINYLREKISGVEAEHTDQLRHELEQFLYVLPRK